MTAANPKKALAERIKELRRRHFGPRGASEFARRLEVSGEEQRRFERGGDIPPADVLVRMCEVTGEDLQWLLTGVSSRGTVVISGARGRHRDFLGRLARLLDEQPAVASPLEAFVELLSPSVEVRRQAIEALPVPQALELVPIVGAAELPESLPDPDDDNGGVALATVPKGAVLIARETVLLIEPDARKEQSTRRVSVVSMRGADGGERRFLHNGEIARCFPGMFGVPMPDASMEPMFHPGDTLLVVPQAEAQLGRAALCKFADETARCRIWLGGDDESVRLGRFADGHEEIAAASQLQWSLEVIYRLQPAA